MRYGLRTANLPAGREEKRGGERVRLAKQGMALLFVLLLSIGTSLSALAAESVTLTLEVQIGSTSALVNGEKTKIEKPYTQNGTVMVPLGVFQRAFGTKSRLEGEDVVRLSYGSKAATFTIGSKTAWVNGSKSALAAAPVMKNGTLMVPLRPVTDMLGAAVKVASGKIVVTLKSDNGIPGQKPVKGDEEGLSGRVGSSYAGWSIDYPENATAELGDNEFSAILGDPDGTYMLQIHVWEEDASVSVPLSDVLEQLEQEALESGETVVDRETFPNAILPYARLITRDLDGLYWEARRYYDQGRVYTLYLGDSLVEDYRELEERAELLDSFRPSFATPGIKTEDLSTIKDGQVSAASSDYGVTLKLPAEWIPTDTGQFEYAAEDGSSLSLQVTSAAAGETLQDWHTLLQSRMDELFVTGKAKPIVSEPLKAAGVDGRLEKLTYQLGTEEYHWNWLVLQQEGYFYILRYSAPAEAYKEQTFRRIIGSLDIDFDTVASSFGKLGQISYLKDKSLNVTKSTTDFQISVPAYWTSIPGSGVQPELRYSLPGGSLSLTLIGEGVEAAAAKAARGYADLKLDDPTMSVEPPQRTLFAGAPAVRLAYTGTDGSPYQAEDIYFRHGNSTYWMHTQLDQAMATPQQLDGIKRALQSFKFLK